VSLTHSRSPVRDRAKSSFLFAHFFEILICIFGELHGDHSENTSKEGLILLMMSLEVLQDEGRRVLVEAFFIFPFFGHFKNF
jgi:hypothetical protein